MFLMAPPHLQPLNRTSTKALGCRRNQSGHQEIPAPSSHRPNNDLTLWFLGSSTFTPTLGLEVVPVLQQFKGASHGKELKRKLVCRTVLKSLKEEPDTGGLQQ